MLNILENPQVGLVFFIPGFIETLRVNGRASLVRDPALHQAVQDGVREWLEGELGWQVRGIVPSPITGPEGNKEFTLVAIKPE